MHFFSKFPGQYRERRFGIFPSSRGYIWPEPIQGKSSEFFQVIDKFPNFTDFHLNLFYFISTFYFYYWISLPLLQPSDLSSPHPSFVILACCQFFEFFEFSRSLCSALFIYLSSLARSCLFVSYVSAYYSSSPQSIHLARREW